jgi:hypothetical protein
VLSHGGQDVNGQAIRLGKVDSDEIDTGLHQRGDEVDVAGEAIELGNDEGGTVQSAKSESLTDTELFVQAFQRAKEKNSLEPLWNAIEAEAKS